MTPEETYDGNIVDSRKYIGKPDANACGLGLKAGYNGSNSNVSRCQVCSPVGGPSVSLDQLLFVHLCHYNGRSHGSAAWSKMLGSQAYYTLKSALVDNTLQSELESSSQNLWPPEIFRNGTAC